MNVERGVSHFTSIIILVHVTDLFARLEFNYHPSLLCGCKAHALLSLVIFGHFKWKKNCIRISWKISPSFYWKKIVIPINFSVFNPLENKIGISTRWLACSIHPQNFFLFFTYIASIFFHLFLLLFDRTDRKNVFSIFIYCFFNAHLCVRVSGQSKFFFRFT